MGDGKEGRAHQETTRGRGEVYVPSEDTTTLAQVLGSYSGARCLEVGFGSGAVLRGLSHGFGLVVGTDIVSVKDAAAAKGGAEAVIADRATCFRGGAFDLVASNPPYLPSGGIEDRTVDGGRGGIEVPLAFLEEALRVLKPRGSIVLLLSDESDLGGFRRACKAMGLRLEVKARRRLFYETLVVFEIRRG